MTDPLSPNRFSNGMTSYLTRHSYCPLSPFVGQKCVVECVSFSLQHPVFPNLEFYWRRSLNASLYERPDMMFSHSNNFAPHWTLIKQYHISVWEGTVSRWGPSSGCTVARCVWSKMDCISNRIRPRTCVYGDLSYCVQWTSVVCISSTCVLQNSKYSMPAIKGRVHLRHLA